MKKIILVQLLLPLALSAQKKNLADTVITKDPVNMRREYWVIHKPNGDVGEQGFMLDGKKDGTWRKYEHGSNMISKIEEYSGGKLNGASMTFGANGYTSNDETYFNDKLEGPRTTISNGRLRSIENYKNGVLEGNKKVYYDNTKIQEDGNWKNGKRHGVTTWYKTDGNLSLEYTYENGSIQGPSKEYNEKGKLKRTGNYVKDYENGEWKEYRDTTISSRDTTLLIKTIIYKDGQVVKEIPVKK